MTCRATRQMAVLGGYFRGKATAPRCTTQLVEAAPRRIPTTTCAPVGRGRSIVSLATPLQDRSEVRGTDVFARVAQFFGHLQPRTAIDVAIKPLASAYRRRRSGEVLVPVVGVLVPQAVCGDAQLALGHAEPLQYGVEAGAVLLQRAARIAEMASVGDRDTPGQFERGPLGIGVDRHQSRAAALGSTPQG